MTTAAQTLARWLHISLEEAEQRLYGAPVPRVEIDLEGTREDVRERMRRLEELDP